MHKGLSASHLKISIHAPAKGATDTLRGHRAAVRNFNPRSREGSDVICCIHRR